DYVTLGPLKFLVMPELLELLEVFHDGGGVFLIGRFAVDELDELFTKLAKFAFRLLLLGRILRQFVGLDEFIGLEEIIPSRDKTLAIDFLRRIGQQSNELLA